MLNAVEVFTKKFSENAERECVISVDGSSFSYGAIWANAAFLSKKWAAEGLVPGDIVALSFPNHVSLLCSYLACALGGFLACPIVESHHPEMKKKLKDLVRPRLLMEAALPLDPSRFSLPEDALLGDPDRPFLLPFSSGLTGDPKPICLSLQGVLGSAAAFARLSGMNENTVLYHVLPMGYMAGILNAFFAPLMAGGRLVEGPQFSIMSMADFWSRPLSQKVNTLSITPTIAAALCRITPQGPILEQVRDQIHQVQCTSAPIPPSLAHQFQSQFSLPLQNCYGMTELGGPLTFQAREDAAAVVDTSVPIPELEISLRGEGTQELWIRSPYSMLGYRNAEGTIERSVDESGFMNTGDTALFLDGKLQITGRKKDVILRGGVNVAPYRLESVLSLAPFLTEVAVVGVAHPFWGEQVVACVVPRAGEDGVERSLKIFSRERLGQHERPDQVLILDQLPRSFIGKIQKQKLRELAEIQFCSPSPG